MHARVGVFDEFNLDLEGWDSGLYLVVRWRLINRCYPKSRMRVFAGDFEDCENICVLKWGQGVLCSFRTRSKSDRHAGGVEELKRPRLSPSRRLTSLINTMVNCLICCIFLVFLYAYIDSYIKKSTKSLISN